MIFYFEYFFQYYKIIMSHTNESRRKEKNQKIKNKKTVKRKSKNKKVVIIVSKCVCNKGLWCDSCYGEYDLFD